MKRPVNVCWRICTHPLEFTCGYAIVSVTLFCLKAPIIAAENSFSFIGVNAIGGIEIISEDNIELKFPGHPPEKLPLKDRGAVPDLIWDYMQHFDIKKSDVKEAALAQGLFGYTAYDAVGFFETIHLKKPKAKQNLKFH